MHINRTQQTWGVCLYSCASPYITDTFIHSHVVVVLQTGWGVWGDCHYGHALWRHTHGPTMQEHITHGSFLWRMQVTRFSLNLVEIWTYFSLLVYVNSYICILLSRSSPTTQKHITQGSFLKKKIVKKFSLEDAGWDLHISLLSTKPYQALLHFAFTRQSHHARAHHTWQHFVQDAATDPHAIWNLSVHIYRDSVFAVKQLYQYTTIHHAWQLAVGDAGMIWFPS